MRCYGCLDAPGASGEEAVQLHFKGAVKPVRYPHVWALVRALEAGEVDGGVLPVEHALEPIHDVVDLLETTELVQSEKFWVPIHYCLLALSGQTISDLQQVLAHPQVLAQCSRRLDALELERLGTLEDTAAVARDIEERRLTGVALVGSARAADHQHLEVLEQDIQNEGVALTRYVLLRRGAVLQQRGVIGTTFGRELLDPTGSSQGRGGRGTVAFSDQAHLRQHHPPAVTPELGWHPVPTSRLAVLDLPTDPSSPASHQGPSAPVDGQNAFAGEQVMERDLNAYEVHTLLAPGDQTGTTSAEPATPALVLADVSKVYAVRQLWRPWRKQEHQALDHLSLEVERGEIFGLLGPNGAGKTTTINIICGFHQPSSGVVRVLGRDVRHDKRYVLRRLGVVSQETALHEELTARENVEYRANLYGLPPALKAARIAFIFDLIGLLDKQQVRVSTFSGGMKRRLLLGCALVHDPELLYLDEPTNGLDVQHKRALWDHILKMKRRGKTVLLTTNVMEEAQALCDRVAIIDHGTLIALDTPLRLKQRFGVSVIALELTSPLCTVRDFQGIEGVMEVTADPERMRLSIKTHRANEVVPRLMGLFPDPAVISSITVSEPHLDEVFLRLTGAALRDEGGTA